MTPTGRPEGTTLTPPGRTHYLGPAPSDGPLRSRAGAPRIARPAGRPSGRAHIDPRSHRGDGGSALNRWLLVLVGLGIAAAGLYALLGSSDLPFLASGGAPPLDDIDAKSRARLERVRRDADRDAAAPDSRR